MILINTKEQTGGPKIFLNRLDKRLNESYNFGNNKEVVISNPPYKKNKNEKIILRLDGCYFEMITLSLIIDFISKYVKLPLLWNKIKKNYGEIQLSSLSSLFFQYRNKHIRKSISQSDHIVFQSNFCKELYFSHKDFFGLDRFNNKKHTIINNGIDLRRFSSENLFSNGISLIVSGRYRPVKRWKSALEIFKTIKKSHSNSRIIFLGEIDKIAHKQMRDYAKANNLSNIYFSGKLDPSNLPNYLSKGNIFLHPAFVDFCPNSVVEALAIGLPVVYSSNGGTSELVNKAGISIKENFEFSLTPVNTESLIPKLNTDKYVNAIFEIYDNLNYYSELAKEQSKLLDIKYISEKYYKIYSEMIK